MLPKEAVVEGRYQVLGALGQGSHGQVYLVEVLSTPGRRLALKEMLLEEADRSMIRRFESEAAAWVGFRHRSAPTVHDFFVHDQAAYVAMDYVPGRTLWDVLAAQSVPPPWQRGVVWMQPVVEVLKSLHSRGMVWRELEPSNCVVQPDGEIRIISLGLGRLFSMPDPNPFSAPEEEFGSLDPKSDIYCLGATIYVLLSRHLPPESWDRALKGTRLPQAPGLTPPVMAALDKMMAILPEDRYPTIGDAWEALSAALTGPAVAPVEGAPPIRQAPQLKWRPAAPARPAAPTAVEEEDDDVDEETSLRNYLNEVIADYEKYVRNIGNNSLAAPMLLYYRDEVQDTLEALDTLKVDTQPFWAYLVDLDAIVKDQTQTIVDEIGWNNFKQYWIMNDPPRDRWWWYLSRQVSAPPPPPRFWEVWKKKKSTP